MIVLPMVAVAALVGEHPPVATLLGAVLGVNDGFILATLR